mgnify:CR=1 FL=1
MIIWIDGAYGVGKSTLAEKLHELLPNSFIFDAENVGNAVRDNMPQSVYYSETFEGYPLWFHVCNELLTELSGRFDGVILVPMTLMRQESFARFAEPLRSKGIEIVHVLLESSIEIIHDRILERGESEDCWCMRHIEDCLSAQQHFEDVIRVQSVGQTADELAKEVVQALGLSTRKEQ